MSALRQYVYRENQKAPLSGQRAKVLQFIKSRPTFPTAEEIRVHMGWQKYASVSDVMRALIGDGYVRRTRNFGRKWELVE
jgi:DNA-binding MarR family transcriptional regulator